MAPTKSLVLSSSFLECISAVDHVAVEHDISRHDLGWHCRYEKRRAHLDACHPGNDDSIVCLSTLFRTPIKKTLKMKPRCNDDLKRNDTLSHNIVLSNSPELPKRLYSKSRRNQMREKSITFLSPLSLPWLNYWNKMLHLEESLERQRKREVGERETLLGTWVPFRPGPSSLRKPLKAVNDRLPVPAWEAVSLLWLGEYTAYTQVWGQSKIIKKNINSWSSDLTNTWLNQFQLNMDHGNSV